MNPIFAILDWRYFRRIDKQGIWSWKSVKITNTINNEIYDFIPRQEATNGTSVMIAGICKNRQNSRKLMSIAHTSNDIIIWFHFNRKMSTYTGRLINTGNSIVFNGFDTNQQIVQLVFTN